jgi:hypothetical protein
LSETSGISRTVSFVPSLMQKSSEFSTVITQSSILGSSRINEFGSESVTPEAARVIEIVNRTPTLGHIFSCCLLIIVGMAFWVYSARMENTLTNVKLGLSED